MILNLVIGIYHSPAHEMPREATAQWQNFSFNQRNIEKNHLKQQLIGQYLDAHLVIHPLGPLR
jgi:hypothetical protein